MNNTVRIEEVSNISIETIKKALIKQHQHKAANDHVVAPASTDDHLETVKRWISPCEFQIGNKAKVLPCADSGMIENSAAQVKDGVLYILANCIVNEKQARDVFFYGSIGLIAIPAFLNRFSDMAISRLFSSLPSDQLETMQRVYGADVVSDERLAVQLYLADLVVLNVTPSFYERRDSWQRMLVRKLYPSLKWQAHDYQYLVYRAFKAA